MEAIALRPPAALRGAATRDALLDAAESLLSMHGYRTPSHRMIAAEAGTHVALVNYHFGSKEMLFETAVERRAGRLVSLWKEALAEIRARPAFTAGDVLRAWWRPFGELDVHKEQPWGNYLCAFARLGTAPDGETLYQRHFGKADREFLDALAETMPDATRENLEAAFRYARTLLAEVLLHRCGKAGVECSPRGYRNDDTERAMRFVEAGVRALLAA
ncbi:MAG: TetR/AcrR family transcriptional regulator [Burkholderiales bacterium]